MLKREWGVESNGKLPHLFNPSKTAALVPDFAVEDLPVQNCNLGSCACSEGPTCRWAEHSDDDDDDDDDDILYHDTGIKSLFIRVIFYMGTSKFYVIMCDRLT